MTVDVELLRKKSKESLYFFAKGILGYDWLNSRIHLPACRLLEDGSATRKLIELPRGWLKTTVCSVSYPIWRSIIDPNVRILIVQNSATNAQKKLATIRRQWENNQLLRALFPELLPTTNSVWKSDSICLSRSKSFPESTYECAGTSSRVVSRHYDIIIEDDTVAPDYDELGSESLAPTHDEVEKAIGWHRTNALPLLNDPTKGEIIIVGTRWYERDLIAWIKENESGYQIYSRAARENSEGLPDPRGETVYPERFNDDVLRELETTLGPYMFSCLYMNTPVRSENMLFRSEWFRYYEVMPQPRYLMVYTTVDFATDPSTSRSKDLDWTVVMTCGKDMVTGNIYVLDYSRLQGSPGEVINEIFVHVTRYSPIVVGYDATSFQRDLAYWIKEQMRQNERFFLLEPIVRSGKDAKNKAIASLQPLFASGTILIKPHMKELVNELLKFPLGTHDDVADALSMQMRLWTNARYSRKKDEAGHDDPFDFDNMVESMRRKGFPGSSVVFDPMRTHAQTRLIYS